MLSEQPGVLLRGVLPEWDGVLRGKVLLTGSELLRRGVLRGAVLRQPAGVGDESAVLRGGRGLL